MLGSDWLLVLLVAAAVAHALIVYHVYRSRQQDAGRPTGGIGAAGEGAVADGSTVNCERCGAENDADYRYCRACVAQLPGGYDPSGPGSPPFGRVPR